MLSWWNTDLIGQPGQVFVETEDVRYTSRIAARI
jgi:hypothetical protein